jgi:peptidoglycan/LPS O-acetylase OafA/YrhL
VPPATLDNDVHLTDRSRGTPLRYMPQLDGLRALAVLAVCFEHWEIAQRRFFRWIEWGHLGVWLFFVLSGFLITDILLKGKRPIEADQQSIWESAKTFYIRRFLRILPIYYLTLFVTAFFIHDVRRLFVWHVTYTTDFWTALHPGDYPYGIHFWTLAIEEQFYLAWPWIILLTPRRWLIKVTLASLALGVSYRALFQAGALGHSSIAALGLPILGNIDKFAFGALLAVLTQMPDRNHAKRLGRWCLWIGFPAVLAMEALYARNPYSRAAAMFSSAVAGLFFTGVIAGAAHGFRGPIGAILQSRPLVYPGKISYGLYLFHPFVPLLFVALHIPLPHSVWFRFGMYAIATLIIATGSWYLFEGPLNSLKRFFPYLSRAPGRSAALG